MCGEADRFLFKRNQTGRVYFWFLKSIIPDFDCSFTLVSSSLVYYDSFGVPHSVETIINFTTTVFDPPPAATGARQPRRSPLARKRARRSSKDTPVMAKDLRAGISTVLAVAFIPSGSQHPTYASNLIPPASFAIGVSSKVVQGAIMLSSSEGRKLEEAMVTEVHEASESTGRMSRAPGDRITSVMDDLTAGGGSASANISSGLWTTLLRKVHLFAFLMDQLSEVRLESLHQRTPTHYFS